MTTMKSAFKPPTEFYTRAQLDRVFGLGNPDEFGMEPATGPSASAIQTMGIAGVLGVLALGIVGTGLTTYFIWRVAKKQRWV